MSELFLSYNNNIELTSFDGSGILFRDTQIIYSLFKINYFGIMFYSSIKMGGFEVDHTGRLVIIGIDEI